MSYYKNPYEERGKNNIIAGAIFLSVFGIGYFIYRIVILFWFGFLSI